MPGAFFGSLWALCNSLWSKYSLKASHNITCLYSNCPDASRTYVSAIVRPPAFGLSQGGREVSSAALSTWVAESKYPGMYHIPERTCTGARQSSTTDYFDWNGGAVLPLKSVPGFLSMSPKLNVCWYLRWSHTIRLLLGRRSVWRALTIRW